MINLSHFQHCVVAPLKKVTAVLKCRVHEHSNVKEDLAPMIYWFNLNVAEVHNSNYMLIFIFLELLCKLRAWENQVVRLRCEVEKGEAVRQSLEYDLAVARKQCGMERMALEEEKEKAIKMQEHFKGKMIKICAHAVHLMAIYNMDLTFTPHLVMMVRLPLLNTCLLSWGGSLMVKGKDLQHVTLVYRL